MKRTALTLDEDLHRSLKARAAHEGKTLGSLVNELLWDGISAATRHANYTLELQGWKAEAQPGIDVLDRNRLIERMEGR